MSNTNEVMISVDGVGKKFCRNLKRSLFYGVQDISREMRGADLANYPLRKEEFWANRDVSFELRRGDCLGLIGQNGAGKTTLLKMLNGLIKPDTGHIQMNGRVGAMIALGAGFNPILTGRENIYVAASVLGFSRKEIDQRFDEIVEFSEIGKFIDTPVQSYSSGMQVRLGFAVASSLDPDILLIDEVLAVGDVGFRTKCYNRIYEVCKNAAVIFVSHSMPQIDRLCNRALVLTGGAVVYSGETGPAINQYNKLFQTKAREWQQMDGIDVQEISINGIKHTRQIDLKGSDPLNVDITVDAASAVEKVEISVNFLEKSYDLISQANNRFDQKYISLQAGLNHLHLSIDKVGLGSGLKLLSIAFVDANTQKILFWAHGGWELDVTNDVYIPSPGFNTLAIENKSLDATPSFKRPQTLNAKRK
ncbi:ABC transporter ATP-binding protein [Kiritimatiellota bacterium B12222]|nr:ABC transporter ATP-binding protein [Kiritimatiellota bacterium B12222]